jgi:hypothetical protein
MLASLRDRNRVSETEISASGSPSVAINIGGDGGDSEDEAVLCYCCRETTEETLVDSPCNNCSGHGHWVHKTCLKQALEQNKVCPLCRGAVPTVVRLSKSESEVVAEWFRLVRGIAQRLLVWACMVFSAWLLPFLLGLLLMWFWPGLEPVCPFLENAIHAQSRACQLPMYVYLWNLLVYPFILGATFVLVSCAIPLALLLVIALVASVMLQSYLYIRRKYEQEEILYSSAVPPTPAATVAAATATTERRSEVLEDEASNLAAPYLDELDVVEEDGFGSEHSNEEEVELLMTSARR